MKLLLLALAVAQLGSTLPHGPDEEVSTPAVQAPPAAAPKPPPTTNATKPAAAPKASTVTPAGCKKLATDTDWPSPAEWAAALPRAIPRATNLAAGLVRPDYHISARNVADVQAAVKFCAQHNVRLTIINSGHDFLGRNNAVSGLSLDVSKLAGVKVLESFTPSAEGAAAPGKTTNTIVPAPGKQAAVTFGAGLSTQRLNNAIHTSRLMAMGAAHGTVTVAGGWGQTAGHGPLTAQYGLGVDQFLEFKVVTADGNLKVANKVSNPDLFWALRGGGGSTFGVVVEATVKAYPTVPITVTGFWINSTERSGDGLWDAYSYLHTQFPKIVRDGVSGYYYLYPNALKATMLHPANISGKANADKFWEPYLEKLATFKNMKKAQVEFMEYGSYKEYFDARFGKIDGLEECATSSMAGMGMMKRHGPGMDLADPVPQGISPLDSRLLGATHFAHPNFTAAVKAAAPQIPGIPFVTLQGHLISAGKSLPTDEETSVLPAWRKANTHLIGIKIPGITSMDSVRQISPDSGAYANEAHYSEENWKTTFWGTNYARLSSIKSKYDPDMVFWTTPGINADFMQVIEGRVCKVKTFVDTKIAPRIDNNNVPARRPLGGESNVDNLSAFPGARTNGTKAKTCAAAKGG